MTVLVIYNILFSNIFQLEVTIEAKTYFGARHALETLSQMIVFDDLRNEIQIPREISITDGPVYPYRGILLDTSRNFVDKATILRIIDGMGISKLNTLHWHIVDSHSFPYVSRTWPKFSNMGSYGTHKIYDQESVKEIVEYGLVRGVRILPEFDAPAHVGEGWQWVICSYFSTYSHKSRMLGAARMISSRRMAWARNSVSENR